MINWAVEKLLTPRNGTNEKRFKFDSGKMHLIRRMDESNRCQLGIKTLEIASCQNRHINVPFPDLTNSQLESVLLFHKKNFSFIFLVLSARIHNRED